MLWSWLRRGLARQRLVFWSHSEFYGLGQADFNVLGLSGLACEMGEESLQGK